MRDLGDNQLKAWARDYEESPFYFVEESPMHDKRLVAWSEDLAQTKTAFYAMLDTFPQSVKVLLKICAKRAENGEAFWTRYWGIIDRWKVIHAVQNNESYVFSDGMHQLCIKEENSERCLAFDDHGIFFIYAFNQGDTEVFQSLEFKRRYADLIFSKPHFQHTPPKSETLEAKLIEALGLETVQSDLD